MDQTHHNLTKASMLVIIGLLIAVTYFLFKTSNVLTSQTVTTSSQAEELTVEPEDEMIALMPDYKILPDCSTYMDWIRKMREKLKEGASKVKVRLKGSGDIVTTTCDTYVVERDYIRTPKGSQTDDSTMPDVPIPDDLYPKKCASFVQLNNYINDIEDLLGTTCRSCAKPSPTPLYNTTVPGGTGTGMGTGTSQYELLQ